MNVCTYIGRAARRHCCAPHAQVRSPANASPPQEVLRDRDRDRETDREKERERERERYTETEAGTETAIETDRDRETETAPLRIPPGKVLQLTRPPQNTTRVLGPSAVHKCPSCSE